MNRPPRRATHIMFMLSALTLAGCSSTRTIELRVESNEGEPMPGAYVIASPLGISASPLPVSPENIKQAGTAPGTGGVAGREGTVRLTIDRAYDYELRLQPPPTHADARAGHAWSWIYRRDSGELVPVSAGVPSGKRPVVRVN